MKATGILALLLALAPAAPRQQASTFAKALETAERALQAGDLDVARAQIGRAQERDGRSIQAWMLRAAWAEAAGNRDERVFSLHRALQLAVGQEIEAAELSSVREQVLSADPIATDLLELRGVFVGELEPIAERYAADGRPHSAIRVHKEILALDASYRPSLEAIEELAAQPDPSLAENAQPKDLLEGVSKEWIREFDEEHADWKDRGRLESDSYKTNTDAGYEVLVRCSAAMEQMNSFYRRFFRYGTKEHGGTVPRIDLNIFKDRATYLKKGIGPPVEWSGGHFTGGAVETYITAGGFEASVGTLFHEAAHQFVSLATRASGWLNEGLASFFEGTQVLPNGTVLMNLPANNRLFPLASRMEQGWMSDEQDGLERGNANSVPSKAPTFRIVLENKYEWGPAWYGPTWGVVYFLYNYQDPADGRFVYRDSFWEFVNKSAGRVGAGAIKNFEEIVLGNPAPPIRGVERPDDVEPIELPETVDELNRVWKEWMLELRDEQAGRIEVERPYFRWARAAVAAEAYDQATEHFEKAVVADPRDAELLIAFASFLAKETKNPDRAAKLGREALRVLESTVEVDTKEIERIDKLLRKWDPERKSLDEVHQSLWAAARGIVQRYQAADLPRMVMDVSRRLGSDLGVPGMLEFYEEAYRGSGESIDLWQLAYNEQDLSGWRASGDTFSPEGAFLRSRFGKYAEGDYNFRVLTLDTVTSGDFSFEVQVEAERGQVGMCGIVFGRKADFNFHTLLLFPGRDATDGTAGSGFIDLATFFGSNDSKTWRHNPVQTVGEDGRSSAGRLFTLRLDVSGRTVDAWFDGEYQTSQQFSSREVLRGSLGLITGPGTARYTQVRYLSRPPGDPAGNLQREVRMEEILAETGGSIGGSYLGLVPPFPDVATWVGEERESWDEVGAVPQLLVMWSIGQNDIVPIDEWLDDFGRTYEDVGLEVVSVVSPNDADQIEGYLELHRVPGAIGVDDREEPGIGDTFTTYSIDRFNLPRVLLLDLDHRVVWEGDPGFKAGEGWYPGLDSFVDAPMEELVAQRKLRELHPWREKWRVHAVPALRAGDLVQGLPYLVEARAFPKGLVPEVDDGKRKLAALEGALDALTTTAASMERAEAEPSLDVLFDWAKLIEYEVDRRTSKAVRSVRTGKNVKKWEDALKSIAKYEKKAAKDSDLSKARALLDELKGLPGRFPAEVAADLEAALAEEDAEAVAAALADADQRPSLWLVRDYFNW